MELSPDVFNDMLWQMGQDMAWRRADACPCRDPHSGAANQACQVCRGRGTFWIPLASAVRGWAVPCGMKVTRQWAQFGLWESGDTVVTIPSDSPLYDVHESDRVLMVQSSEPFSVPLISGSESPLAFQVTEIERVFWLTSDLSAEVAGAVPAVAEDGTVTWPIQPAPPVGTQYTMTGRKMPEFYVFIDFPVDRQHFGGQQYPRRVVLRKFDLAGR